MYSPRQSLRDGSFSALCTFSLTTGHQCYVGVVSFLTATWRRVALNSAGLRVCFSCVFAVRLLFLSPGSSALTLQWDNSATLARRWGACRASCYPIAFTFSHRCCGACAGATTRICGGLINLFMSGHKYARCFALLVYVCFAGIIKSGAAATLLHSGVPLGRTSCTFVYFVLR